MLYESSQDTASISENISKAKVHSSPQKVDTKNSLEGHQPKQGPLTRKP